MKKTKITLAAMITALFYVLFILTFAVVLILNFRPLYYQDINRLKIVETSGLTETEIRENYDALIDYNSILYDGDLEFPTLTMSESGRIHFEEVKAIFVMVQYLCLFSFIGAVLMTLWLKRHKTGPYFLRLTSVLTLTIPLILGLLIALNWENFFVTFHHIFFQNDYWIFDSTTDPVITILPDTFFMHCAIGILLLVICSSILTNFIYLVLKNRSTIQNNVSTGH